jgi:hypothetical protein
VWTHQKTALFSGHYLHNRSTLDMGVSGYIGILYHKEHPPEVWHIYPGTSYIYNIIYYINIRQKMNMERIHLDLGTLNQNVLYFFLFLGHEGNSDPPGGETPRT